MQTLAAVALGVICFESLKYHPSIQVNFAQRAHTFKMNLGAELDYGVNYWVTQIFGQRPLSTTEGSVGHPK
jgi:hypothetical protein